MKTIFAAVMIISGCSLLWTTDAIAQGKPGAASGHSAKVSASSVVTYDPQATIVTTISADLDGSRPVLFRLYRKDSDGSNRVINQPNVPDCSGTPAAGAVCKDTSTAGLVRIVCIPPAADGQNPAQYDVAVDLTDKSSGEIGKLLNVAEIFKPPQGDIQAYYKTEDFRTKITGHPNGELQLTIQLATPLCKKGASGPNCLPRDSAEQAYLEKRIAAIYEWLDTKTIDPSSTATVLVEPLDREIPDNKPLAYEVSGLRISSGDPDDAVDAGFVSLVLVTKHAFPTGKYSLKVNFADDAPRELSKGFAGDLAGITGKPPDASRSDSTLGLRAFSNNLDLGLAFTSQVNNVTVGTKTIRQRQDTGIIDLRFAPWLNRPLDHAGKFTWTPLFIDSKASTGQVNAKTLSLNRTYIGTQAAIRLLDDIHQNKYIFTFRGVNASDRDFKRAEGKFEFEFRPLFRALNDPLASRYKNPGDERVLIPGNVPNPKQVLVGWFGYQIQPFIGAELGDVYRASRNALNVEEQSRTVRRLVAGNDILFNLTKFVNIKLSDTVYLRGETKRGSTRNYFIGELDAPLMTSGDTSQCVFISYERGDQPPFATPGVNSFKIGYRITSNLFQLGR